LRTGKLQQVADPVSWLLIEAGWKGFDADGSERLHLPDGTAILAGAGLVVYGLWAADNGQICRRNQHDPADKQRCVTYERVDRSHFRNSDGVAFCLGPCEADQ